MPVSAGTELPDEAPEPAGADFFEGDRLPVSVLKPTVDLFDSPGNLLFSALVAPVVAPELLLGRRTIGHLNDGVEQVGQSSQSRPSSQAPHLCLRLGLRFESRVQHPVEASQLLGNLRPVQIILASFFGVEPLPLNVENAPAAEGGLEKGHRRSSHRGCRSLHAGRAESML